MKYEKKALMSFGIIVILMVLLSVLNAILIVIIDITMSDYFVSYLCGCTFIYFWKVYDEQL